MCTMMRPNTASWLHNVYFIIYISNRRCVLNVFLCITYSVLPYVFNIRPRKSKYILVTLTFDYAVYAIRAVIVFMYCVSCC